MLDPKLLRENLSFVIEQLKKRDFAFDEKQYQYLEGQRKQLQTETEKLLAERNSKSKLIGQAKARGEDIAPLLAEVAHLGEEITSIQTKFDMVQNTLAEIHYSLPNILHESVPYGLTEDENIEIRKWGIPRTFTFKIRDHVELGEINQRMDFETAAKIAGARFVILHHEFAKLHRALIQFMLDTHTQQHDYKEIYVPYIVNAETLYGTGQLPKFAEDLFALKGDKDYYLISTSEISVTNTVRDRILEEAELPLKFTCHSPCFRSEAGSYGKDTRGMIRQHQFEKVEMVQIVKPENSYTALEEMTSHAEKILQLLELPYRTIVKCSGDTGATAAKTYDIEVWIPSQNTYREISSCSNTEAFQARRLQARYRNRQTGKTEWVHTLNGSGLAVGRALVAILENYQNEDGSITIPQVLNQYLK